MNENKTDGAAKVAMGRFESAAGDALGDDEMRARGDARRVEGHVQETAGSVQDALGDVADEARAAFAKASDAYGRVSSAARDIAQKVEEQPFAAVGVAAAIGLLVGLLIAGRGPKVVYVKPRT